MTQFIPCLTPDLAAALRELLKTQSTSSHQKSLSVNKGYNRHRNVRHLLWSTKNIGDSSWCFDQRPWSCTLRRRPTYSVYIQIPHRNRPALIQHRTDATSSGFRIREILNIHIWPPTQAPGDDITKKSHCRTSPPSANAVLPARVQHSYHVSTKEGHESHR